MNRIYAVSRNELGSSSGHYFVNALRALLRFVREALVREKRLTDPKSLLREIGLTQGLSAAPCAPNA